MSALDVTKALLKIGGGAVLGLALPAALVTTAVLSAEEDGKYHSKLNQIAQSEGYVQEVELEKTTLGEKLENKEITSQQYNDRISYLDSNQHKVNYAMVNDPEMYNGLLKSKDTYTKLTYGGVTSASILAGMQFIMTGVVMWLGSTNGGGVKGALQMANPLITMGIEDLTY